MLAIVCPGQGSQTPGFLSPWLELPGVRDQLELLGAAAGIDLVAHGTTSDAETIRDTAIAQPLIVAAGLVTANALFGERSTDAVPGPTDPLAESAAVVGGHSVGEYTAAALTGVLSPEQAMILVRERGRLMAAASAVTPTGMSAVLGGDPDQVITLLAELGLTAANRNGAGQVVAAGTLDQLAALKAAPPAKARVIPLSVAGAFHTAHMAPAVEELRTLARGVRPTDPSVALLSNADGVALTDGAEILRRLVSQVSNPVRWDACMTTLRELGVTRLIELSPAGTLAGLAKRALPGVTIVAVKTPDDLEAARALLADEDSFTGANPSGSTRMTDPAQPRLTVATGAEYARIMSVGGYLPSRVVTNEEICQHIDSSDEWIRERSGVVTRHFAAKDESVTDMAEAASKVAIERAGLTGSDIDAVVVATVTHPYQTPSAASLLAHRLGATPAAAMDISAACAGFSYGVGLASDMVRGGSARHVLVVGVEKLTDFVDPTDRSTAFIFGDGAGAVVIGPSDHPAIGPTLAGADGSHWDAIVNKSSWIEYRDNEKAEWPDLKMAGQTVFRWAVWQMSPVAQKAVDAAGITTSDLAAFIPHQANVRIVDAMVKQLRLPDHIPVARHIAEMGNTSAASIPLAMERMLADGEVPSGGLALLIGFGAGLAYAAQVVELP